MFLKHIKLHINDEFQNRSYELLLPYFDWNFKLQFFEKSDKGTWGKIAFLTFNYMYSHFSIETYPKET